jgi:RND family efflux transporter MFP subunit
MPQLSDLLALASVYQGAFESSAVYKILVHHLGSVLGARAVLLWTRAHGGEGLTCADSWFQPGSPFRPSSEAVTEGFLFDLLEAERAQRFGEEEIAPEAFIHLGENDRERVSTALYAPITTRAGAIGVVEILNSGQGEFSPDDAAYVEEACRLTAGALNFLGALDDERSSSIATVDRLTALYDISRVFSSTLELSELLPIMAEKIRDILQGDACNIWLVESEGNVLKFAQQAGEDPTTDQSVRITVGEGFLGQVANLGGARLVASAEEEPLLEERRQAGGDFELRTLMCAPLLKEETVLGVVEVVNKADGQAFDDDDLFFLSSMAEQASIALTNANLFNAERRAHDLNALLATSKELTSTLNLDHVLTTVVHQAATVVPFDLCAIGIFDRSQFVLGAVSGESEVPQTPKMEELRKIMEWVAAQEGPVSADRHEEGWAMSPDGEILNLTRFMEEHGYGGFHAIPLRDDQGCVGVLALLNGQADFLTASNLEILSILASQTTVAVRNARLYQEVPLASFLRPFLKSKQKLEEVTYGRWVELAWKAALVIGLLVIIPFKFRIQTNATAVPAERRVASAEVSGVIQSVPVREGERVQAGEVVASLVDTDYRVLWQGAITNMGLARRQLEDAEARKDWAAASQAQLSMDLHQAEADLYREKVHQAQLRAPITGVVVTPKVEEKVGQFLKVGDTFCEVVDEDRMAVEMNVPETDVRWIRPGAKVALKLNALPTQTLLGQVVRVSPQTITAENEQFFVTRAVFPNPGRAARPGMAGQAKITAGGGWFETGWYPVGFVMFRAPASWAWREVWSLIP